MTKSESTSAESGRSRHPRATLREIMRDDPAVAWLFLRRLSARVRELVERLDRASTQGISARLAAS
ncbi:MAG: hypothetical protein WD801_00835 [Gemmatimonadaceae bacterium]